MNPVKYLNQKYTNQYFKYNPFKYMLLVFITGDVYHVLEIIYSNFLSISWFDAAITKIDIDKKSPVKVISIIICEDISQPIISISFTIIQVILTGKVDKLAFSVIIIALSIFIAGFTLAVCVINKKSISLNVIQIRLEIKTLMNIDDKSKIEEQYKGYKNKLCSILLLHKRDIEIGYIDVGRDDFCKTFIYKHRIG